MKKNYLFTIFILIASLGGIDAQTGSWTIIPSGTTVNLLGVSAPTASTVYVCGIGGVIRKSTDGGLSWTAQTSGTAQDLYSIYFTDVNNGYAAGSGGAALKTTNGGASWSAMSIGITEPLRSVNFTSSSIGYITGGVSGGSGHGTILKTTDAGSTWSNVTVGPYVLYSTFFTSSSTGYATAYDGKIWKTSDGGTTWPTSTVTGSPVGLSIIYFTDALTGMTSDQSGNVVRTTNGGSSYTLIPTGVSDYLSGIDFYDSNHGFIVGGTLSAGSGRILTTTNGGASWTNAYTGTDRLLRVDMFDQNTGYIVGNTGTIMKYTNTIGINEPEELMSFNCYPNPFSNTSSIDCSSYQFKEIPAAEFYDVNGKLVDRIKDQGSLFRIERKDLVAGMYFYKILDGQKLIGEGKLLIE